MRTKVTTTRTRYSEISRSAPPALRPILCVAALLVAVVVAYEGVSTAHDEVFFFAIAFALLFVARGLHLNRPVTLTHATAALLLVAIGDMTFRAEHSTIGFVMLAASGAVLMLPQRSHPQPEELCRVAALVDRTTDDPLAPFALHSTKSYFFDETGTAAIGYRTRAGIAVVAGDPIGSRAQFEPLIDQFARFAHHHGWRIAVLGAGERGKAIWSRPLGHRRGLHPVAIGRDVVIDVPSFNLDGRRFRNLRQAVNRTHNFGVKTEVVWEAALSDTERAELTGIVAEANAGQQTRGFSMILDHLLDGRHPGMLLVIARDLDGRAVGFQRYGTAGNGKDLSIDVPWRSKDAPNGLDERMTIDAIEYGKDHGAERVSLAFAAFPDLFENEDRGFFGKLTYTAVHLGDPLLCLESLYRFLKKFHALGDQRYVMLRLPEVVPAAFAMLTLEFVPHRRQY